MPDSRRWVIRSSIAAMTCGTQPPAGSSAVFQAAASTASGPGVGQRGGDHLTGAVPPAGHPGVGGEDHRPDHPVGQRLPVAVGVVGDRAQQFAVGLVVDERDPLPRFGPERGAGQAQPAVHVTEGLGGRLAPGQAVTGVVDLVEHDQGALPLAAGRVDRRPAGHLRVGRHVPVRAGRDRALGVGHLRVEHHARTGRRRRPTGSAGDRSGTPPPPGRSPAGAAVGSPPPARRWSCRPRGWRSAGNRGADRHRRRPPAPAAATAAAATLPGQPNALLTPSPRKNPRRRSRSRLPRRRMSGGSRAGLDPTAGGGPTPRSNECDSAQGARPRAARAGRQDPSPPSAGLFRSGVAVPLTPPVRACS